VRRTDRLLAVQLYQRGVPLSIVENALVLAAARRLFRPPTLPPLNTVRSFAYFLPAIDEVLELKVSDDYFQHIRHRTKLPNVFGNKQSSPGCSSHSLGCIGAWFQNICPVMDLRSL
jgi:hypothetical protein